MKKSCFQIIGCVGTVLLVGYSSIATQANQLTVAGNSISSQLAVNPVQAVPSAKSIKDVSGKVHVLMKIAQLYVVTGRKGAGLKLSSQQPVSTSYRSSRITHATIQKVLPILIKFSDQPKHPKARLFINKKIFVNLPSLLETADSGKRRADAALTSSINLPGKESTLRTRQSARAL